MLACPYISCCCCNTHSCYAVTATVITTGDIDAADSGAGTTAMIGSHAATATATPAATIATTVRVLVQ